MSFTSYDRSVDVAIRKLINIPTGAISDPTPNPPSPGVPSIDRLDKGEAELRPPADVIAIAWASDAQLIYVGAQEESRFNGARGAFVERHPFGGYQPDLGDAFYPPGIEPMDGKAPMWGFLYYSPSKHELLPVYVYTGMLALPGLPVEAWGSPNQYSAVIGPHQPASNMTKYVKGLHHQTSPVIYHLAKASSGELWEFVWSSDPPISMTADAKPVPTRPPICHSEVGCDPHP